MLLLAFLLNKKFYTPFRMPTADNSQTQRARFLRTRALASFRFTSPKQREEGPSSTGTDDSVRIARSLGQRAYNVQLPGVVAGSSKSTTLPCLCLTATA